MLLSLSLHCNRSLMDNGKRNICNVVRPIRLCLFHSHKHTSAATSEHSVLFQVLRSFNSSCVERIGSSDLVSSRQRFFPKKKLNISIRFIRAKFSTESFLQGPHDFGLTFSSLSSQHFSLLSRFHLNFTSHVKYHFKLSMLSCVKRKHRQSVANITFLKFTLPVFLAVNGSTVNRGGIICQ